MNMIASDRTEANGLAGRLLGNPALVRDRALIDGAWRTADDGGRFEVADPATGTVIGSVPAMGIAETEGAIAAAARALPAWAALLPQARAAALRRWHDAIRANREDLARLITLEQGKPLREARDEVDYGASFLEWCAEETRRLGGEVVAAHKSGTEL
jgi:acyl-CoA reductase-like NAD-dependent aldehyde dehydrogenase